MIKELYEARFHKCYLLKKSIFQNMTRLMLQYE